MEALKVKIYMLQCSQIKTRINAIEEKRKTYYIWAIIYSVVLSILFIGFLATFVIKTETITEIYNSKTVYVTYTGECYHNENCGYLKSSIKTTIGEAEKNGYRPCSRCNTGYSGLINKNEVAYKYLYVYKKSIIPTILFVAIICIIVHIVIKKKIKRLETELEN